MIRSYVDNRKYQTLLDDELAANGLELKGYMPVIDGQIHYAPLISNRRKKGACLAYHNGHYWITTYPETYQWQNQDEHRRKFKRHAIHLRYI